MEISSIISYFNLKFYLTVLLVTGEHKSDLACEY